MAVLRTAVRRAAGLLGGLAALAVVAHATLIVLGYRPVAVLSGSMQPKLPVGSIVYDRPIDGDRVRVGDAITFGDPTTPGRRVTHRVVARLRVRGQVVYRTKGDANPERDPWTIALPPTVGRVAFDVPFAGYALVYGTTREVRTTMVGLACLALLRTLLRAIWRRPRAPEPAAPQVT